jgi:hypothetical protein
MIWKVDGLEEPACLVGWASLASLFGVHARRTFLAVGAMRSRSPHTTKTPNWDTYWLLINWLLLLLLLQHTLT